METLKFCISIINNRKIFYRMLLSTIVIALILTLSMYMRNQDLMLVGNEVFSSFFFNNEFSSIKNMFIIILPLLMSLVYGDYHYYEKKVMPLVLVRSEHKNQIYVINAIFAFLQGFFLVLVFLGAMLLFQFIITYHPDHTLSYLNLSFQENHGTWNQIFYFYSFFLNHPYLFIFFQSVLIALFGGLLSLFTYVLSLFCKLKIITYIATMAITLLSMLGLWVFIRPLSTWNTQLVFAPGLSFVHNHPLAISFWLLFFLVSSVAGIVIHCCRKDTI